MIGAAPRIIDARGLRCPWPALRLARAMREQGGGPIVLLADDPAAPREIAALAEVRGWTVRHEGDRYQLNRIGLEAKG